MLVGVMDGDTDGTLTYGRSQLRQLNNRRNAILIDLIDAKKKN
jgi:hypothetical protein